MLEKVALNQKMEKKTFSDTMDELSPRLALLQRQCKAEKIPISIVFEGFDAAGKGNLINQLIGPMDPRGFEVHTTKVETLEEKRHPFLWRFWTRLPEYGRISIFDHSWYRRVLIDRFEGQVPEANLAPAYEEINNFERQLTDDGMVIVKFFLAISKEEQEKRMKKLKSSPKTSWRVSKEALRRNKHYEEYLLMVEEMLEKTNTPNAPWNIIEATDREYAAVKIISAVISYMEEALSKKKQASQPVNDSHTAPQPFQTSVLSGVDLNKTMEKDEYKKELKRLQKELSQLHNDLYRYRIPVVLAFEGWDAGGKGGAIKRLTQALDPRGYVVNPVASPNDTEKAHHYLWRFWTRLPKDGHIAIFDRSWYGRVMVERIEGFCTEEEWKRAYAEMNEMEEGISNHGAIILKFWMHIDKDEQERRFKERQETPEKQWKITDEDWRNRAKWDQYQVAVDEMLLRTSTTYAPWIIVEANSKYYARIKVLKTVVSAIQERIKEAKEQSKHGENPT